MNSDELKNFSRALMQLGKVTGGSVDKGEGFPKPRIVAYGICKNCGAPLKSSKCEYCGTEYGTAGISGKLKEYYGEVIINGEAINVYVLSVTGEYVTDCFRDDYGKLRRSGQMKRTFTLVEV